MPNFANLYQVRRYLHLNGVSGIWVSRFEGKYVFKVGMDAIEVSIKLHRECKIFLLGASAQCIYHQVCDGSQFSVGSFQALIGFLDDQVILANAG
jgi:hypothetical protein